LPVYHLTFADGRSADVFANGIARIYSQDHKHIETRVLLLAPTRTAGTKSTLPDKGTVTQMLLRDGASTSPYKSNLVVVVFRDGIAPQSDVTRVPAATIVQLNNSRASQKTALQIPQYTNDDALNRVLTSIGTDRSSRLFRRLSRSTLSAMSARAQSRMGHPLLDIGNAYQLHIIGTSVAVAVSKLMSLPSVTYASPEWRISSMQSERVPIRPDVLSRARLQEPALSVTHPIARRQIAAAVPLPSNYAVTASAQSMLNAPGVDALAAYEEIATRYNELPGEGETVTNVSVGDLDDASAATNNSDPCNNYVEGYGPTTVVIGGQRYIDWPSMPLIPTYTSDDAGNLSGLGEVCGNDPFLEEVGLDLTVMTPLPHEKQRPGEQGSGFSDMLGIAPGAKYRLVVPADAPADFSDIQEALLGAALQQPQTNVISASLGYGFDVDGYPGRYLEDDPLTEALVASIVNTYNIVVTIAAGDGLRTYTNAAVGPNGGSAPTNAVLPGAPVTALSDIYFSTVPSLDLDSGSIDVGGTTLDDIFATPPQYAVGQKAVAQHAYAETRWTGFTNFSSGEGSRVNLSAPADNIVAFSHGAGAADSISIGLSGGTSAAAPETAAAAAIVLQVARLSGRQLTAVQVRSLFEKTASSLLAVPQANVNPSVGQQLNVRKAVETLISLAGGPPLAPNVARVAVEQRQNTALLDGAFTSDTDPANISLSDTSTQASNQIAWITIAPDWEFLPAGTQFQLYVTGHPTKIIGTTQWTRALPATILNAAGDALISSSKRTVNLTYDALLGTKKLATTALSLTFGPAAATHYGMLAPKVPAVVTGSTIAVSYDFRNVIADNPILVVSQPGRMSPATGSIFRAAYSVPLTAPTGTIDVPVSSLAGGGMYGVDVVYDSVQMLYSDPAFTRVAPAAASPLQPAAPVFSSNGSTPGHYIDIPYGSPLQVGYDVTSVPGATGAMLEFSAPAPGAYGNFNDFNNPGGSICDNNHVDSGSVYCAAVSGTKGSVNLNWKTVGLDPGLWSVVRVLPMKGTQAAGEAGEVSTIRMDGVPGPNGANVNAFGINRNGADGFVTGTNVTASGTFVTAAQTFDQTTLQYLHPDYSNITRGFYDTLYSPGNPGLYAGDVSVIADASYGSQAPTTYGVLQNSVALQNVFPMPEPTDMFVYSAAPNSATGIAAVLGLDGLTPNDDWVVYTSNLLEPTSANPNGPLSDINLALPQQGYPYVFGLGENPTTNTAEVAESDFFAPACSAPTIVSIDLTTAKLTPWAGIGSGTPFGIAVDPLKNLAALPTSCDAGLTIYNLATKQGAEVLLPTNAGLAGGFSMGAYPETDSKNAKILVAQAVPPDIFVNNNPLSQVLVYNDYGQLLESEAKFNLFLGLDVAGYQDLQITGQGPHAYLLTAGGLVPFDY
jgi:hypothetical protein